MSFRANLPELSDLFKLLPSFPNLRSLIPTIPSLGSWLPYLVLISLVLYAIYYGLSYFHDLRRYSKCLSLVNLFNGSILNCLDPAPEYCQDINPNLYWGYCADRDYEGVYPGDTSGPYGFTCQRWITNPQKCPPLKCRGEYPLGIKIKSDEPRVQEYGWCADPAINRALLGTIQGPSPNEQIKCQKWIWNECECPISPCEANQKLGISCPAPKPQPVVKPQPKPIIKAPPKPTFNGKCQLTCGLVNGKVIACPPPDCQGKDTCPCNT